MRPASQNGDGSENVSIDEAGTGEVNSLHWLWTGLKDRFDSQLSRVNYRMFAAELNSGFLIEERLGALACYLASSSRPAVLGDRLRQICRAAV